MRAPSVIGTHLIILALMAPGCGYRPADVDVRPGPGSPATGEERALIAALPGGDAGFLLYDLGKHETVRSHHGDRGFIPASTTKVLTTVAALEILGPGHRFETRLCRTGSVSGGVLRGDLFLKGGGDPLLTVADLMDLADAMEGKGIREVAGRFIYDETALAGAPSIDPAMDPDVSFNTGLSALSLEYNALFAEWKRDRKSGALTATITPSLPMHGIAVSNEKLGENVTFSYRFADGVDSWLLSPDEKGKGSERLPVRRPALYTAHMFAKICGMRGIRVPPPSAGAVPRRATDVAVHRGAPLADMVDLSLTYSINVMTELMLLAAAKKLNGSALPLGESAAALTGYLEGRMENISWKGCRLVNGSGLTPRNRITPEQMASVLVYADAQDYGGRRYRSFLPASGWEWSLLNRFNDPSTAFHVWAKTGTINYALALAGYLYTASGRPMAFSIFICDVEARRLHDADPGRRGTASAARVNAWQNAAKKIMDDIVTGWIRDL